MGDRACVDLASLLHADQGLLVGAYARGLFLVLAETEETPYAPPRPFRVNAGAVGSYVMLPDNRTAYLAELRTGGAVLVCDAAGERRPEALCRVKVERRPMVVLEATIEGTKYAALLQNVATVRLATPAGPRAVTELRAGDAVLLSLEVDAARHKGVPIYETCSER